ncbi:hypothetical protein ACFS4T_12375 [Pseudomonas lini]
MFALGAPLGVLFALQSRFSLLLRVAESPGLKGFQLKVKTIKKAEKNLKKNLYEKKLNFITFFIGSEPG